MAAACNYPFTVFPLQQAVPLSLSAPLATVLCNGRVIYSMQLENNTEKDKSNTGQEVHFELDFG